MWLLFLTIVALDSSSSPFVLISLLLYWSRWASSMVTNSGSDLNFVSVCLFLLFVLLSKPLNALILLSFSLLPIETLSLHVRLLSQALVLASLCKLRSRSEFLWLWCSSWLLITSFSNYSFSMSYCSFSLNWISLSLILSSLYLNSSSFFLIWIQVSCIFLSLILRLI